MLLRITTSALLLLASAAALAKEGGASLPVCDPREPSTSGKPELRQLFLWPVAWDAGRPIRYRFLACMAAPVGQVRQGHSMSLMLFRPRGHFYTQGGQTPCRPDSPKDCSATTFEIEAEDLFFDVGRGDLNGPAAVDQRVLANLFWKVGGVERNRRMMVTACPWPKPANGCPKLDELVILERP